MDDVQSWWEIPCIAHFCSLFRLYFDLIDFDIEELEEALLTDSVEEVGSSLLQDLIVRLLKGCFNSQKDEITTCNYQMYLRRLFRKKCEEGSTKNNPFDKDAAFHSLPLRTKVEILYDLCDFRLDNDDVPDSLKSLEADSLRVEPLGQDSGGSTYWYFYGTRLYREDYTTVPSVTPGKKRGKKGKDDQVVRSWQVVCYTEEDWQLLTRKFKNCKSVHEKKLHRTLRDDFLPELPRLFAEKERLQRKRMMEQQLRRSGRTAPESSKEDMPTPSGKSSTVDEDDYKVKEDDMEENDTLDEGEIRRQREEQEKADRLLAEEIEREERMTRLHLRERRGGDRGFSGSDSLSSSDRTSNQNKSSSQRKGSASGGRNSSSKSPSKASAKRTDKNSKKKNPIGRKTNNSLAASLPSGSNSDDDENEEPDSCDEDDDDDEGRVVKSNKKTKKEDGDNDRVVKRKKKSQEDNEDSDRIVKPKKKSKDEDEDSDRVVKSKKKSKDDDEDSDRVIKPKKTTKDDESDLVAKSSKKTSKKDEDDEDHVVKNKQKVTKEEDDESRSRSSSPNPRSSSSPAKKQKKDTSPKNKRKKGSGHEDSDSKRSKSKNKSKDKKRLKLRHKDKYKSKDKDRMRGRDTFEKSSSILKSKEKAATKPVSAMVTVHSTGGMSKTKMKSSVLFSQSEEDVQIGMHKVIESIKNHGDAWPFLNPVDEDYAPNYYRVISSPMDLQTMEDKLDNHEYSSLEEFIADFQRIVDNCTKYNGPSNEYTEMAETLQEAFNKAIQRYIIPDESDEEISIEYNNTDMERKRPRLQNHSKKEETPEHKKENEPTKSKKTAVASKTKVDKYDKKKIKQKLMGHHSRNSEAIENLSSATAETLKDINKWLGDTPKPPEYLNSSPGPLRSENVKTRIPDEDNDADIFGKKNASIAGQKRKNSISLSNRSPLGKRDDRLKNQDDDDDEDEDFTPPKKMLKKSDKHGKSDNNKPKTKKDGKEKADETNSLKKSSEKDSKDKHYHKHHKHHHTSSSSSNVNRKRESSPKVNSKLNGSNAKSLMGSSGKHGDREKDHHNSHASQPKENSFEKLALKHAKSSEEKKAKPPIKRGNNLLNSLKNSGAMKRMQQINKTPKFNSFHAESKFKPGNGEPKGATTDHFASTQGTGRENGLLAEKPEKKKCLLLNDNPSDREGGPRLSLGSVLSTDAIKLGEFKKDEAFSDDDYESTISVSTQKTKLKSDSVEPEEHIVKGSEEKELDAKVPLLKDTKEMENELEREEELEADRKLEPSKGFNREKCMPNLSAWIKAFGGPAKAASGPGTGNPQVKKPDPESKNKFKVMGRGVGESNTNSEPVQKSKSSPGSKTSNKSSVAENFNQNSGVQSPLISPMKPGEQTRINPSEEISSSDPHHTNKKRRHRKMSTSSLSSQSESGSPHCFTPQDGSNSGVTNVVNPPRWVDEHWTQSHSQSQSPSASSHVSSQSPANSPFSPAINSPPHTPQTPPRPVGPVHVGFYQDITPQHSGPKNPNEPHSNSNSNVASPSTPPTPTNNSTSNSRRGDSGSNSGGGGKAGYGSYPAPVYTPRYAASTPSPNVGPGSNLQSPSPGGMGSVESPGDPNSPHSPNINVGGNSNSLPALPDYRNLPSSQQHNPSTPHSNPQQPPAHQQQPAHRVSSSILNAHGGHAPPPSIAPYPPPVSHYGHPGSMSQPHPESSHGQMPAQAHQPAVAHMNQVQAHSQISHQQHYERYPPHNLAHHQMNPQTGMLQSSVPTSSTVATSYSQNMTAAHSQRPSTAQPSPYPSNPYASNPRSINIPPNVYNNPISSDPAMNRFYKPSVSGGELSLTANMSSGSSGIGDSTTSTSSSSSSHSRSRSSRANAAAAAAAAAAMEAEMPRNSSSNLDGKLGHSDLNGFQWPHNLASLSQIVNSIPNPMGAVGMANAYRQYDQAMAESMSKYQRADPAGYTSLSASAGVNAASARSGTPVHHPPAAHSQSSGDKGLGDASSESSGSSSRSRSSKSAESKASRSQSSKVTAQSMVPGSAFNFSSLSPADLALYPKEMTDPGSLYSASQSGLAHRPDLYPTSSSNFHPSFSSASRTTAGGVPTPYQIPPFIGSHPSPYQPQSVSSQPFAHSQPPRGLTVDPYQQFFQSSPHVMGLLPPAGYPYPHGLGFNRPGWI